MRIPLLILAALLAAAVAVGLGGVRMSRRQWQERIPADRTALRNFAEQWQNELARLKEVYEQDLEEIAYLSRLDRPWGLMQECRNVYGIRAGDVIGLISHEAPNRLDRLTLERVDPGKTERLPDVWQAWERSPEAESKKKEAFLLRADEIAAAADRGGNAHGWLPSPNANFGVFWYRRSAGAAVLLLVDWREVGQRTNQYLVRWAKGPFGELRASDPHAVVLGAGEIPVMGEAQPASLPPDLVIPIQSRLGAWQIVSRDRITMRAGYSRRGLIASLGLSAALALLGILVFRHQVGAQRIAEQRVSFVNRVSHELGTPLTNVLLNLDLATEAIAARPEQARERLGFVVEEVHRLARLVSNVLTFSRKERGVLSLAPSCCVPDEVIGAALRQFQPALRRRGIEVEFRASARDGVRLDPDALAQIVGNLFSNVEKYAAAGQRLEVGTRQEADVFQVTVRDFGPGIPGHERDRIFQPFERLSNRVNEGASGAGLGLAIARDLADRMGGAIVLAACEGPGCRFDVTLPAPRVLAPVPLATPSAA